MKIKFQVTGFSDGMRVTKSNGEIEFVSGIGVLQYLVERARHMEFSDILLDVKMHMSSKDAFELEQVSGAKVSYFND